MSPITLALAGLLAYQTYHGRGRLAEMMGRTGPTGPDGQPGQPGGVFGDIGENLRDNLGRIFGGPGAQSAPGAQGASAAAPGAPAGGLLGQLGTLFGAGAGSTITSGLQDLLRRFQEAGRGETAQSWVNSGPNQPVQPTDVEAALGEERIAWLMRQTGMSREALLQGLSRELPAAVDELTPKGRVPTEDEASRLAGGRADAPPQQGSGAS